MSVVDFELQKPFVKWIVLNKMLQNDISLQFSSENLFISWINRIGCGCVTPLCMPKFRRMKKETRSTNLIGIFVKWNLVIQCSFKRCWMNLCPLSQTSFRNKIKCSLTKWYQDRFCSLCLFTMLCHNNVSMRYNRLICKVSSVRRAHPSLSLFCSPTFALDVFIRLTWCVRVCFFFLFFSSLSTSLIWFTC